MEQECASHCPGRKDPSACRPGLFPHRSPSRIPADGTKGHRALSDTQVGLAGLGWGGDTELSWDLYRLSPTEGVTLHHWSSVLTLSLRALCVSVSPFCLTDRQWSVCPFLCGHGTHLEPLPVTSSPFGLAGPPLPLLKSPCPSAEGKHRSQEKQGAKSIALGPA